MLHLEPQGRCLNDANARRGRKPFRLTLQVRSDSVLPCTTFLSSQAASLEALLCRCPVQQQGLATTPTSQCLCDVGQHMGTMLAGHAALQPTP